MLNSGGQGVDSSLLNFNKYWEKSNESFIASVSGQRRRTPSVKVTASQLSATTATKKRSLLSSKKKKKKKTKDKKKKSKENRKKNS
eukprot:9507564-Ditylum_brightwellii.AAC.1